MALTGCRVAPTPSLCSYRRKGRTKRNNHFTTSAVGDGVYSVVEAANGTLKGALANGGGLAPAASFAGGLAASFAPCSLSLVPLTLGYVGSLSGGEGQDLRWASASFCTGMTITFTSLGFTAGLVGSAYGGLGVERGLEEGAAAVAVMSGLRLLGVMPPVEKVFPSFEQGRRGEGEPVPPLVRAGCAGGASALCASPCSTPVLASLLAFVAASESPAQGGGLLLCYSLGYSLPFFCAAFFAGSAKKMLGMKGSLRFLTPLSGMLLVGGGVFSLADSFL